MEDRPSTTTAVRRALDRFVRHMQPVVFLGSAAIVIAFVIWGAAFSDAARTGFEQIQHFIVTRLGWIYVGAASAFVVFPLWLLVGPYGGVRLGGDDARPEFGRLTWITMLFSAGMGTGLVFWSVAEPLGHLLTPPDGPGARLTGPVYALRYTFFHWGLHPWAIYVVFGVSLAYLHFRRGLPLAPRSLLHPLIGERIHGWVGHVVDIVATVGTLFGVATSLGLGAMQINAGLADAGGVPYSVTVQVVTIASITVVATISVVSGIHRGIRGLSQLNMALALGLLVFVLVAGPTLYVVESFVAATGSYLQNLVAMSLWIDPRPDRTWQAEWTLFYWSWWISWSPFVGVFTARISKGRTIREYVVCVLGVPTLATLVWLSVFGATGLHLAEYGDADFATHAVEQPAVALYRLLDHLPGATWTSVLATLLVVVFFVTSSDSGSLVDDMVTSGGDPDPPRAQRVFWALAEGAVAASLLLAGGLHALRTASLTSGLPMTILLAATCWGLVRAFRKYERQVEAP